LRHEKNVILPVMPHTAKGVIVSRQRYLEIQRVRL
jgi:hypothetical protein